MPMQYRRVLAAACVVAGVWLLAGLAVALLAAAPLLLVAGGPAGVPEPVTAAWSRIASRAGRVRRSVVQLPRHTIAVASMGGGIVAVPTGVGIAVGVGVAVAAAGVLALGLSLLVGWTP